MENNENNLPQQEHKKRKQKVTLKSLIKKIPKKQRKKVFTSAAIIASVFIFLSWMYFSSFQTTDDAFIEGRIIKLSPKVSGNISKLYIDDNQIVKKGDLLMEIEPQDYETKVEQLKARLEIAKNKSGQASQGDFGAHSIILTAQKQVEQSETMISQATEALNAANADLALAKTTYDRFSGLYSKGAASKQKYDESEAKLKTATANQKSAAENLQKAKIALQASSAQKTTAGSQIKELAAMLSQAELDVSYTKIYAPTDGVITSRAVEQGVFVQRGQPLFAIVPSERWVVANFKETQLTDMKEGQAVKIKVDAFPKAKFEGTVDSIQRATGSKTSLFPPENAVGSYVKIVQRVPVKITFNDKEYQKYAIQPGMSVVPSVKIK